MNLKTFDELKNMTTREIAHEAKIIINIHGYDKAKELLKNHIEAMNFRTAEVTAKLNKKFGVRRSSPKIRTITDFLNYKI